MDTADTLPQDITLSSSGILSGTPTELGAYFISVNLIDSAGETADKLLGLSVVEFIGPLSITTNILDSATKDSSYRFNLVADGGSAPYQWTLISGNLPSTLSLNTDGTLTGTPDTEDTIQLSLRVTDNRGETENKNFTLVINKTSTTSSSSSKSKNGIFGASLNGISLLSFFLLTLLFRTQTRRHK